jgi:putative NADH-flavin reductase
MKLALFGAMGGTGRSIFEQALQQGHEVVAFVRDPQQLRIADPRLRI